MSAALNVSIPEPPPQRGGRAITILVVRDIANKGWDDNVVRDLINDFADRDDMGFAKHHQNLETNDGRFTEKDAYEELLDAAQYYRKMIEESVGDKVTFAMLMYHEVLNLVHGARVEFNQTTSKEHVDALNWESGGRREEK